MNDTEEGDWNKKGKSVTYLEGGFKNTILRVTCFEQRPRSLFSLDKYQFHSDQGASICSLAGVQEASVPLNISCCINRGRKGQKLQF